MDELEKRLGEHGIEVRTFVRKEGQSLMEFNDEILGELKGQSIYDSFDLTFSDGFNEATVTIRRCGS